MNEAIAWINGSLCPFSQAAVPVWDMGVVAGASVTEMARTFAHHPFRLERHVERLMTSLTALGFPQPWPADSLHNAAMQIVDHNSKLIAAGEDLGIVLFSTAGSNPTYLSGCSTHTTTVVHTFVLPFAGWRSNFINGVRLQIPSVRQIPEDCFSVTHKVRNRLHWWLADQEASRRESGSRALLLDQDDYVTETSTSCFYIVRDDRIVTSSRGVLNSLSSQIVEEIAGSLQIPFERRPIPVAELTQASEAFLSSTPVCLLPVSHINGRQAGFAIPGPVFRRLIQAWSRLVGIDVAAQIVGSVSVP
jgi:branched-subunit amino acid aminotransferase/4-amino-4-deoxychorismate lyase